MMSLLSHCHGEKWSDLFQSLLAHNSLMADLGEIFLLLKLISLPLPFSLQE